ncbi:HepT-like ribonuclease domain-containing protein [Treponema sp. R80B11-R83G3]
MPLSENDLSYFIDIIDCIFDINEFTNSIEYHQFEKDKMRRLAVERQLEVIGQAANKISIDVQNNLKNIPWKNIIGLRNKLAHDYGEILAERTWKISKDSIQALLKELDKIDELKEYINSKHNVNKSL